jgi:hypothetical protein
MVLLEKDRTAQFGPEGIVVKIYVFKSESDGLSAFVGDPSGSELPSQFAPWQPSGAVEMGAAPPHNFSRYKIESEIKLRGYQLWRLKRKVA